jgi:hypothetical protein
MCCTKWSSVINSIYSGQELFSYTLLARNGCGSPAVYYYILSWTNFSYQDKTWAEFSTLEATECVLIHLSCCEAKGPNLTLKTRSKQLSSYLPLAFEFPNFIKDGSCGITQASPPPPPLLTFKSANGIIFSSLNSNLFQPLDDSTVPITDLVCFISIS